MPMLSWLIGSSFLASIIRIGILFPFVYLITDSILSFVLSSVGSVVISSDILPYLRYFYVDTALSYFFTFLQLKIYLYYLLLWLRVVNK